MVAAAVPLDTNFPEQIISSLQSQLPLSKIPFLIFLILLKLKKK
jgi:hypothetical protein